MNKKKSTRSQLSTSLAKTLSYFEVGKIAEARQWAAILQSQLIELTLLVDNRARMGDNVSQSDNATTSTTSTKGDRNGR